MLMLQSPIDKESLINFDDDSEINILAVAAVHQKQDYYECSLPPYPIAMDEFSSHFRVVKDTTEALCRQVHTTGRIPQRLSFGKPTILLEKNFLVFV